MEILFGAILLMLSGVIVLGNWAHNKEWERRKREYPEHEIVEFWDDRIGGYWFEYRYYGRKMIDGDRFWANAMAQHYGVKIVKYVEEE